MSGASANEIVEAETCTNCGETLAGPFCAGCGQRHQPGRLRVRDVLHGAVQHVLGVDSALRHTIVGLTRDPGAMIADYVAGRRARYVNPIKYSVGMVAVYLLLTAVLGVDPSTGIGNFQVTGADAAQNAALRARLLRHLDLVLYLSIPLFGLLLRAYYWRAGRNLAEIYSFAFFLVGQSMLYSVPLLIVVLYSPAVGAGIRIGVRILLFAWAAVVFFRTPGPLGWLRGLGVLVLYTLSIIPVAVVVLLVFLGQLPAAG